MNLRFKSLEISLSAQEQEERQQLMARYEEVSLGMPTENTRDVFFPGFIMVLSSKLLPSIYNQGSNLYQGFQYIQHIMSIVCVFG